jgi:hypothetical protein
MISETFIFKKNVLLVAIIAILLALMAGTYIGWSIRGSADPTTEISTPESQTFAPTGSAALFGMISNIKEDAGTYSLDLRLAEAVSGSDWREQNAIEDGRCTLEMVEQNNCAAYFYTRMTQKTLHIAVDKNVVVTLIDRVDTSKSVPVTMNELKERFSKSDFSETPFHITTTQGVITEIQEQYIP